ncbi:MAG: glycosyltransferase family 4 protein [Anaerolineales bacterium]|nr:glycosyltransferase family 4 protein [Anaerolineales bacterium]
MLTSASFPPREGMGFYIWNLSRYLLQQGYQVQIITRGGFTSTRQEVVAGITIWRPPYLPLYPFHVHLHTIFVNRFLHKFNLEIDLLHLHTPLVKYPHTDLPSLVTVHTPMKADSKSISVKSHLGLLIKLQAPISIRIEQEIFAQVDSIASVSHNVALDLGDYGINPETVRVLGNGVDTCIFQPGIGKQEMSPPFLLTVCRLGPRKGLEDLIACARHVVNRFPNIRFYIAGEGPFEGIIKKSIRTSNLTDNVFLLGHIKGRRQLADYYRRAAAIVHPAHYEGLPTSLLEAMSCGRPVVATAVSGALDVIKDGFNGLLVSPRAPNELACAIQRLLEKPGLAENLGYAARKTIEERYSWPVIGQEYISQYKMILGEKTI